MDKIGFIGTGVMGASMAGQLQKAGYPLLVYNRTRSRLKPLLDRGAEEAAGPAEIAATCPLIFTMLGYPEDVESVYFDPENGLLPHVNPDTLLIDCTTSTPTLAAAIARQAARRGALALDAPVSGGDVGAREARLSIMCGGSQAAYDRALPYLKLLGKQISRLGEAGQGQHCKMCNQLAIAPGMLAVCEALTYAEHAGMDPEAVLAVITQGAAGSWSLSNYGPRILKGDFEPGFFIKHFVKDLKIALDEARRMKLELPGLQLALRLYQQLEQEGLGQKGTQALYLWYRQQTQGAAN
ncbi:NAD(P)-dependent oxidoreductase [Oscillospiraceae bacterium HV4-5-C5C]|nr:NAD(P)-dependent oxidoreductase [Oscillospiraceae bacterium HV4-5-C5C]